MCRLCGKREETSIKTIDTTRLLKFSTGIFVRKKFLNLQRSKTLYDHSPEKQPASKLSYLGERSEPCDTLVSRASTFNDTPQVEGLLAGYRIKKPGPSKVTVGFRNSDRSHFRPQQTRNCSAEKGRKGLGSSALLMQLALLIHGQQKKREREDATTIETRGKLCTELGSPVQQPVIFSQGVFKAEERPDVDISRRNMREHAHNASPISKKKTLFTRTIISE